MSSSPVHLIHLPSSCGAIGPVPGLTGVMAVLQARRARRRLRWLGRTLGVGVCVSFVIALGLVVVGEGPVRLLPDCARREHRAHEALLAARRVQLARMAAGDAPTTSLSDLGLTPTDGVRFVVTDVVGLGPSARFHLWALLEADAGQRGALVITDQRASVMSVVDVCGGR